MKKRTSGRSKRALFKEGVSALAKHVRRAVDITRQDHPLSEVQDLCQGLEALMDAAENAADLGYSLEVIAAYQPVLPGMDRVLDEEQPS
jgi:hypothetical protein